MSICYSRVHFVDFNIIVPLKLFDKLETMSTPETLCHWLLDFLLNRPHDVNSKQYLIKYKHLNTGAPQVCVLSPLFHSLFTNDCRLLYSSLPMIKFADDAAKNGQISNRNETAYHQEIKQPH